MTPGEISQMAGIAESTLAHWRHKGKGPKYIKIGRKVMYRECEVEAYLDKHTVTPVLERT